MKTKTSHSWQALQAKEKDLPECLILIIVGAGFLGFYFAGLTAEWLINLKTLLIN